MKLFHYKIRKISHRLTVVYAVLFFVALVSANAATLFSVNYYMNQTSAQQLDLINQAIKNDISVIEDIKTANFKDISQMSENIDINLISDGEVIYYIGGRYNIPYHDTNTKVIKTVENNEDDYVYLNDIYVLDDNKILHIQIIKDMDKEQEYLHVLSGISLVMDVFILIISIFVGYIISKKALNPIDKIINQAKLISVSDLTMRIHIDGPDDELKRLSDTFNDLIARIQYSYEKQNQFTLDASHELATPMAVIKGYIDLIDRWGKEKPEIVEEGILSIKREISNMTGLLDKLFFISKSDNEILNLDKTKFWLNELISEVVKESKLVTDSHDIFFKINESIYLEADRRLIKQMLRAIIDNSIKYTSLDGMIEINSKTQNDSVVISISDSGCGIPKEALPHIFDRFYRVDKARSREFGGTGLGLSIVKWIVEIHSGSITAESEVGEGTKITIRLPLTIPYFIQK